MAPVYFPPGILHDRPKADSYCAGWYASVLEAVEEAPLYPGASGCPLVYRLLYLPAFKRQLVVRASKRGEYWEVTAKALSMFGCSLAGKAGWEPRRTLGSAESEALDRLVRSLGFWAMPVSVERAGLDGTMWVLEGIEAGRYHVIQRWQPEESALLDFGKSLVAVSGVNESRQYCAEEEAQARMLETANIDYEAAERERLAARRRAEELSRRLAAKLSEEGLTCPHCRRHSREIRFIDRSQGGQSVFICRLCGRSSRAEDFEDVGPEAEQWDGLSGKVRRLFRSLFR